MADETLPPSPAPAPASPSPAAPPLRFDKDHPYWNENHPDHTAAVERKRAELLAAAGGPVVDRPSVLDPKADPSYRLSPPAPQGDYAPDLVDGVSTMFQTAGLPKATAQGGWDYVSGFSDALPTLPPGFTVPDAARTETELRASWGEHYDAQLATAQAVVRTLDATRYGGRLTAALGRTRLGDHPTFVRFFAKLGQDWTRSGWRP